MPAKKPSELYSSLGYYKHGKTAFYAELSQHLGQSKDLFKKVRGILKKISLIEVENDVLKEEASAKQAILTTIERNVKLKLNEFDRKNYL